MTDHQGYPATDESLVAASSDRSSSRVPRVRWSIALVLLVTLIAATVGWSPAATAESPAEQGQELQGNLVPFKTRWTSKNFPGVSTGMMAWKAVCISDEINSKAAIGATFFMKEKGVSKVASMRMRVGLAARQNVGGLGSFRIGGKPYGWVKKSNWTVRTYTPSSKKLNYTTPRFSYYPPVWNINVAAYEDLRVVIQYHWHRNFRKDTNVHQSVDRCTGGDTI